MHFIASPCTLEVKVEKPQIVAFACMRVQTKSSCGSKRRHGNCCRLAVIVICISSLCLSSHPLCETTLFPLSPNRCVTCNMLMHIIIHTCHMHNTKGINFRAQHSTKKRKKNTHRFVQISFSELQQPILENKIRTASVPKKKKRPN